MNHAAACPMWCARGPRCRHGEHRAAPVTLTGLGPAGAIRAVAVVTRAQINGRQQVDIQFRIALPPAETAARRRLVAVLAELQTLLDHIAQRS